MRLSAQYCTVSVEWTWLVYVHMRVRYVHTCLLSECVGGVVCNCDTFVTCVMCNYLVCRGEGAEFL